MSFVLDASVSLTWCFADESTDHSNAVLRSLRDVRAIVPALWIFEVENALVSGVRRKRISKKAISEFRDVLADLPIDVQAPPNPWGRTAELLHDIAVEQQITAYDASYLTIAVELGIRDARRIRAAGATGTRRWRSSESDSTLRSEPRGIEYQLRAGSSVETRCSDLKGLSPVPRPFAGIVNRHPQRVIDFPGREEQDPEGRARRQTRLVRGRPAPETRDPRQGARPRLAGSLREHRLDRNDPPLVPTAQVALKWTFNNGAENRR